MDLVELQRAKSNRGKVRGKYGIRREKSDVGSRTACRTVNQRLSSGL